MTTIAQHHGAALPAPMQGAGCHGSTPPVGPTPPPAPGFPGMPPIPRGPGAPPITPPGFAFDPFAEIRQLLQELLQRLDGLGGPGGPDGPPPTGMLPALRHAVPTSTYPGQEVGYETRMNKIAGATPRPIRIGEVLGATSDRTEALRAARIASQRMGRPVAIVEHRDSPTPPFGFPMDNLLGGAAARPAKATPGMPARPARVTYEIVVLDPALDPSKASSIRGAGFGQGTVTDLVFGKRSAAVNQPFQGYPLPGPMPMPMPMPMPPIDDMFPPYAPGYPDFPKTGVEELRTPATPSTAPSTTQAQLAPAS